MSVVFQEALRVGLTLGVLGFVFGGGILLLASWAASKRPVDNLADRVNELLPQIQCAKCGYPGCLPYAEAVVSGERTDLCPPGGRETAIALADLLGRPIAEPTETMSVNTIALIDESRCVGCALCIDACPVDAIVGAERFAHTVIIDQCTGCELCMPVCPVDCIDMHSRTAYA